MGLGVLETKASGSVPGTVLLFDNATEREDPTRVARNRKKKEHIVLSPQPSDDPNDPLNWSSFEKHLILFVVLLGGIIVAGCPMLAFHTAMVPMSIDLHTSYANMARLAGYLLLASGITGPFIAALARKHGKRPMYLACSLISLAACITGELSTTYKHLVAARILAGVGTTSYETVITATIGDLFFVHERGPRVALVLFVIGALMNVIMMIAGVITARYGWRYNFHILVPFNAVQLILTFLFVPETAYKRRTKSTAPISGSSNELSPVSSRDDNTLTQVNSIDQSLHHINSLDQSLYQASTLNQSLHRVSSMDHFGISPDSEKNKVSVIETTCEGSCARSPLRRKSFIQRLKLSNGVLIQDPIWKMVAACAVVLTNVGVSFVVFVSSIIMAYLVVVGILTPMIFTAPPYHLKPSGVGYTSVGSLVGGLVGAFFMSGLGDPFVRWLTRRNKGIYEPEFRLPIILVGAIATIVGLVGFGHVVEGRGNLYLVCFFWGVLVFGIMIILTATNAYALDSFAVYAVEIFMMNMVAKSFLFYGLSNVIVKWFNAVGPAAMFDTLAGITAATCTLTIPMYIFGKRYRRVWARHDMIKILNLETDKEGTSG